MLKMSYKITFHTVDGKAIIVDDVVAENQVDAWKEVCELNSEGYLITVNSRQTLHQVMKHQLVSIETKDKSASSFKNTETAMAAIDALSNMGI